MQPFALFDEMALPSHHLARITYGSDFKEWGIRLPDGAVLRDGAPTSAQPQGIIYGDETCDIDPEFPISIQVLDPLQRGGNSHVAARRRLGKAMAKAGFAEVQCSKSSHGMHMVFALQDRSVDVSQWLASVPPLEPNFVVDLSFDELEPPTAEIVQLSEIELTENPEPPAESRINEMEERWKLRFPNAYRAFLLKYNGGVPTRRRFEFNVANETTHLAVHRFHSVFHPGRLPITALGFDLESALETRLSWVPQGLIPIAHCEYGGEDHLLCLVITDDQLGAVVLPDEDVRNGWLAVAANIPELIERLV